jgi:hypothetical protein
LLPQSRHANGSGGIVDVDNHEKADRKYRLHDPSCAALNIRLGKRVTIRLVAILRTALEIVPGSIKGSSHHEQSLFKT